MSGAPAARGSRTTRAAGSRRGAADRPDLAEAPRARAGSRARALAGHGSPGESLAPPPPDDAEAEDWRRRLARLALFRLLVISIVLGSTLLLAWLSDADLALPAHRLLLGIIIFTYALTIVYALLVRRTRRPRALARVQLTIDLAIATLLVHITGGAESAYTFFYPLAIIGAATMRMRAGAAVVAVAATALFCAVSLAGWAELLPGTDGGRMFPSDPSGLELARALGLNVAAFTAVAFLSYSLGHQLKSAREVLQSERSATADLRALHADIVRSLSSGLLTVDKGGVVLTQNAAAADILGWGTREAAGQSMDAVMPGLGDLIAPLGERDRLSRAELAIAGDEGDLVLGISISPLFDHRDQVIGRVISFQDLTELRRVQARYEQAQRLAVVGRLAAGVAHEIRNPLASISGSLELLRKGPDADAETRALTDIVTREIERLNGLVTDLLDYTNPDLRDLTDTDVASVAEATLRLFAQDRSWEGVEAELAGDSPAAGPVIAADADKLQQVLWNLLRNAAQAASAGGGTVRLRVSEGARGDAVIAVEDDGPGIPDEHIDRIFDPFYTTKSGGTGLGLATVQSVVHAHRGEVWAENRDVGCAFVLRLPARGGEGRPDSE